MKILDNISECTGCATCYNICPHHSIKMEPDAEGFLFPQIDELTCVNCGLCRKKCPVNSLTKLNKTDLPVAFLCKSKESSVRKNGASGGLFTALAKDFISSNNGVVYGAVFEEGFVVSHKRVSKLKDVWKLSKSKYVQSNIRNTYEQVKLDLKSNKRVLFSGTACQVYGLRSYLGRDYANLYCIDVICHGVPSPMVFNAYLKSMEKQHASTLSEVKFREKEFYKDFYRAGMQLVFNNGEKYYRYSEIDTYGQFFWGHFSIRKSCYNCHFKTIWRISDLTIGDCWFSEMFISEKDAAGFTLAFAQSQKGQELLQSSMSFLDIHQINSESAIKTNGGMIYSSCTCNNKRNQFFNALLDKGYSYCEDVYSKKVSWKYKVIVFLKNNGLVPSFLTKLKLKRIFEERLMRQIPEESKAITLIPQQNGQY